ncbi:MULTISPECIES: MalY/PatB family protein [Kosmotoga]|uniref:cysteine-S-conjugate beta-lyase n=1 Tax=Kosmotoga olearia (strain ATCC BAA-1733 / DSM 21960 / TBF 19.5.1) TaxID=521045 RepID=C5CID8_KOSOT|nr:MULTISPECIES: pyridoxal phosphate-dependent aminotransferase [Kosmotoga]ACR78872.1 aminotransferase class I and II [Kosmotoga olearia TBF 19.5.1]OAA24854.1 cystathionine beta-lyase [Kosmotoga sp. DU53]
MEKYDFDKFIDRRETNSYKWDYLDEAFGTRDLIPMWVADMDFEAPKPVIEAIKNRAQHGCYGYTARPDSYYESIMNWLEKRHSWKVEKEWLLHSPGVVPGIVIAILAFTNPGDKVIIQTPVYHPFYSTVRENGRQLVKNPLKLENGKYFMNFEDLESKIDERARMLILCNPHNPGGRVWTEGELLKLGELCIKHDLIILSDEIHSDIIMPGYKHIPIASISQELADRTITYIAPSKTFNLAGLTTSTVIISNQRLRRIYNNMLSSLELNLGNVFGIVATEAAYRYGEEWLEQLLKYLKGNLEFLKKFISERLPEIKVVEPEGTYLVWLDFRGLGMDQEELRKFIIEKAKLGLNDGVTFGEEGKGFQRMNIACPRSILKKALEQLETAVKNLKGT